MPPVSATLLDSSATTFEDLLNRLALRGRELRPAELERLATSIGRLPELWRAHVRHDPDERYYALLHRDEHVETWLLCWTNGQGTDVHDHDESAGAFYVCEGAVHEERFEVDEQLRSGALLRHQGSSRYEAGDSVSFDRSLVHAVRHRPTDPPARTIHAYSPPLGRMRYYDHASNRDQPDRAFWARSDEM